MKEISKLVLLCVLWLSCFACSGDRDIPMPEPPEPGSTLIDGFNYSTETPDADQPLTITFKAAKASPLYGYTKEVYLYAGVIADDVWMYMPAKWAENTDKCKMSKSEEENVWSITLSPSIREWFGSGETAVRKLGLIVRSEDGELKGVAGDTFLQVTDTKYKAFEPAAIKNAPLPAGVKEGINVIDNSTVTLVLYDKDKNGAHKDFAHVIGDFNDWTLRNDEKSQMFRDDASGCWWITLNGLDPTKEYAFQYYVGTQKEGSIRLADAYCEKILDPDNDPYIPASTYPEKKDYPKGAVGIASVFKIQKEDYNWQVTDFSRPDKDELLIYELHLRDFTESGDLNGAMQELSYIKALGVNAIELMPVQEFDGNDSWGYNPCFYFAMDKAYGTPAMYKQFIDACHKEGIAVILDVVYNHATGAHPFAKLYWNAAENLTADNNPWFNVKEPHPYGVFHDFNHESLLVKAFVKRNLAFLLEEYHVDGFRFDLTKGFTQASSTEETAGRYDGSRIAILKEYNKAVKDIAPDAYVILEHFCEEREEAELAAAGMILWRNLNEAYCQSAMGYVEKSSFTALTTRGTSMPADAWVGFMESHDEERMAYKQKAYSQEPLKSDLQKRMKQLATNTAFFLTVSGPKMIWQFGEMGYDISIDEGGRTGKKTLHWEYLNIAERRELHDTYAKLIALRKANPDLFGQNAFKDWKVSLSDWDAGRFLRLETTTGKALVVVGNFSNTDITVSPSFTKTGDWKDLNGNTISVTSASQTVPVPAHEYKLYYTGF